MDESTADFIEPTCIAQDRELHTIWLEAIRQSHEAYCRLAERLEHRFADEPSGTQRRKLARQAARSVLPNATETKIFVTANARALATFHRVARQRARRDGNPPRRDPHTPVVAARSTEYLRRL